MSFLHTIINNVLYYIFLYTPDPLLYFFVSIAAYVRSFYRILAYFQMKVELYSGYKNGYPVKMLWIGTDVMKGYILERLYDLEYQMVGLKSTNFFNLRRTIDNLSAQADLVYVEMNSLLPQIRGYKRIKQYVFTKMKLEEYNRKKYKDAMKLINKNAIEFKVFQISKNIEKLRLFYNQLYAPYISSRWGEHRVEPFKSLKRFYAKGEILLAYFKGEIIAGRVFSFQKDTLVGCKYGIRDAKNRLHRAAASYYRILKYAEEHNFIYFSSFHAKPFVNDGVFRYKREWGLNVSIENRNYYFDTDLYFKTVNYTPGVVAFLDKEPFLFVQNKKLIASLLCSYEISNPVDEIIRQYNRYRTEGITLYEFSVTRELTEQEKHEIYQKCRISEGENMFIFTNYSPDL